MKDQTRQIFVQAIAIVGFLLMAFIPFFQGKSDVFFNLLTGREFLGCIWLFDSWEILFSHKAIF